MGAFSCWESWSPSQEFYAYDKSAFSLECSLEFPTQGISSSILCSFQYSSPIYVIYFGRPLPQAVLVALPSDRLAILPCISEHLTDVLSGSLSQLLFFEMNPWHMWPSINIHKTGNQINKPFPFFLTSAWFFLPGSENYYYSITKNASWLYAQSPSPSISKQKLFPPKSFSPPHYSLNLLLFLKSNTRSLHWHTKNIRVI